MGARGRGCGCVHGIHVREDLLSVFPLSFFLHVHLYVRDPSFTPLTFPWAQGFLFLGFLLIQLMVDKLTGQALLELLPTTVHQLVRVGRLVDCCSS